MENKVLVKLIVPEIDMKYDVYIPINKKIGNIIVLLNKAVHELTNGIFPLSSQNKLYNVTTKKAYQSNVLLANSDIRNGTILVLIS